MKKRNTDLLQFGLWIGIVVAVAALSTLLYFKWDLTEENRNSLSEESKALIEQIEEPVYVRVYLHGEFPADYKRLEQTIEERLAEFNSLSGGLVEYEFIDPYEEPDEKKRVEIFKSLDLKGLKFSNLTFQKDGAEVSKIIWPGALIEYQGKEFPIMFMRSDVPIGNAEMLNQAVNNLEYEFISAFRGILRTEKPSIAVLQGHGEIDPKHIHSFLSGLAKNYNIQFVTIDGKINAFSDKLPEIADRQNAYDLLIVAGTDQKVGDKDRFVIDQFVMNGGKVLWLLDALAMDLDSLRSGGTAIAIANETGLYEMLYEYGARLNRDMVIDYQGAPIVLDNGPMGNQRNYVQKSNYYAPVITSEKNNHIIARNLDPIFTEFAGNIDTVNHNPEIHKTPFLFSSPLSKEFKSPVRIDLELLREDDKYFMTGNKPNQILGLIMEGSFPSAFRDQLPDSIRRDPNIAYRAKSADTKMIVISDADIAYNEIRPEIDKKTGDTLEFVMPLGYDRQFKNVIYDNRDLLMNCVNYLLGDESLIDVRSKNILVRKLNKAKIVAEANYWKVLNTAVPLVVLALMGSSVLYLRKKKWSKA